MGIVLRIVGIMLAVVIVIGVLGTVVGVGANLVRYMTNQGFDFQMAFNWSWNEFREWVDEHNPFTAKADNVIVYEMVNQNVDVRPCTEL